MDLDTMKILSAVHHDSIEIDWIPYDRHLVSLAHFSISSRSIHDCLSALNGIMSSGRFEAMEGADKFYFWCKFGQEG